MQEGWNLDPAIVPTLEGKKKKKHCYLNFTVHFTKQHPNTKNLGNLVDFDGQHDTKEHNSPTPHHF